MSLSFLSDIAPADDEILQVEDEPALEIALPQVFTQPDLTVLRRGKLPHVEWLVARLHRTYVERNGDRGGTVPAAERSERSERSESRSWDEEVPRRAGVAALGPDYQALANEFQPLFTWGVAGWDFLLSTEGCRFLLRSHDEKLYRRGDYRVVTDRDYGRLLHRVFRQCLLDFAQTSIAESFSNYLRAHFWDSVVGVYRRLEDPPDPRQRKLTGYSYLRCIPYQFLNAFHHDLVARTLVTLPAAQAEVLSLHFLNFLTAEAVAQAMRQPAEAVEELLRRSLLCLLVEHRLVYCLLRQIERY